jgi:glycosyltransferase involved in cell wall biosynthesis
MRIAQISTVSTPVRRDHAGSVESLVWLLSRELTRLGHEVTVFGAAGSQVDCDFVQTLPGTYGDNGSPDDWNLCEWTNLAGAIARAGRFDVVHSHVYTWGIPLIGACPVPMVHTLHILPYDDDAAVWRLRPDAAVTALSKYQWAEFPDRSPVAIVPSGVDPDQFTVTGRAGDHLLYLGRFIENKGPLDAITAARSGGRDLILAGPESAYFTTAVKPLVDGKQIRYVGPVDTAERNRLLGSAAALIYPLREPEPFGLVQVEAMMCGTPVVAPPIGAVPEIVDGGVTGELVLATDQYAGAISRAAQLDRFRIARIARERFAVRRMAEGYLDVYRRQIGRAIGRPAP